ncbi:hypothetical protein [Rubinisphaera italica]|uniref:Uncharacterized protein n=1 Tax=Rubinisphaera italica TaxID=2527969 RepID=A0A5C5XKS0_9PLAN|nr:hypothetical protein [Rubinisphaera italica]TWT62983.1 hypothetical protein Pan54_37340 [Rubinisphaera italica]
MWPFRKASRYTITREGDKVFLSVYSPIQNLPPKVVDQYLSDLQSAVRNSVEENVWKIVSSGNMQSDPKACEYVEIVRRSLIDEFGLKDDSNEVWIGNYHLGMIVIGFNAKPQVIYPYYYKGIQLKPLISERASIGSDQ